MWYQTLTAPRSKNEDRRRREYILTIVLLATMALALAALVVNQIDILREGTSYRGVPVYVMPEIFLALLALYLISRLGFLNIAASGLSILYLVGATFTLFRWGVDLPIGLMVYVLVIVLSGITIGIRAVAVSTLLVGTSLFSLWYIQSNQIVAPLAYWKSEPTDVGDIIVLTFIIAVIAVISWLYSRDIAKSLHRARTSEQALRQERDTLGERVEERTTELKRAQLEKMLQVYRFAEFGRLASGFFHDLINPLNVVSLNLEQLQQRGSIDPLEMTDSTKLVRRAIEGTKRIESFVQAAQKQIKQQSHIVSFSLQEELEEVMTMFAYKAKQYGIRIRIENKHPHLILHNDPVKFHQLITNVLSNAIDSYRDQPHKTRREILIQVSVNGSQLIISVQDWGCGIAPELVARIFEPLFTTKESIHGMGLGLAIAKTTAEKDFGGTITVESRRNEGSIFTITIPIVT